MIQVLFSSIITLSSVFIIIYRFKGVINQKRNSMGICLARIGLIISFATFFITIVSESMVQSDLNTTDHPCKNYNKDKNVVYFQNGRLLSTDSDNDYCKDKSNNYNAKICENIEYTISYLSSTILECCSFLLIFFWFNDLRRIKEKDSSESKENENNNRNNNDNKNKIKKEENFKVSIYNNKKRENDIYKRTSIKKHNTNLSSNKNKIKEIHNIEKDITNIEEIKENNNDMCDLDLYSDK